MDRAGTTSFRGGRGAHDRVARRVALGYAVVAGGWIVVSDLVLARVTGSTLSESLVDLGKGLGFVAVTAVLLHAVLRRLTARLGHAAAEAEESESRHRDLFENAADAIVTVDLDRTVTGVNRRAEELFERPRAELVGRHVDELTAPEDVATAIAEYERKVAGETSSTTYLVRIQTGDGRRVPVEVSSRVIEHDGRAVGVQAICRDLSDRTELEAQLLRAQRMEAVGRLAGGVAHDFNNLLTAIGGYAEFLAGSLPADDPRQEDVEEIRRATDRASALTHQLLAVSRRQVLQPRDVDLGRIVAGMEEILRRTLGGQVRLVTSVAPDLPHVRADPAGIEQVLLNLSVNARDAMPGGGTLTIAAASAATGDGSEVVLSVADDGTGMDEETQAHAFEPFFTTKAPHEGSGLGLSVVYGIVQQSGGSVAVESTPGRGTRIAVHLPAVSGGLERRRSGASSATGGAPGA